MQNIFKNIGPGPLVAAAFIGPGTVTICTLAGVTSGFTLLWAMLLSIIATVVLQEMSARLGLVSGKGLSALIRQEITHPSLRFAAVLLMISAIAIGNAAYEAGNISGSVLGIEALGWGRLEIESGGNVNGWSLMIGLMAASILMIGNYKLLERLLVFLVILMSLSFIITAILTQPNLYELAHGLFVPSVDEHILTVIALVGTTVVPYNLFLHASLVTEKWKGVQDLKAARRDTYIAIVLGGLVSMAIIISAASIEATSIGNGADLALSLEPLFGVYAKYFIGIGLGAAGLTSAITAPLAAAYVVQGCLGWDTNLRSAKFRGVWASILGLGVLFSSLGYKPIEIIKFAQVANGLLLPIVAGYLLILVNRKNLLGNYVNTTFQNGVGIVIWMVVSLLGLRSIFKVFELF